MSFGKSSGGSSGGLPPDHPFTGSPITRWKTDTGFYPANSMSWWVFKRPVVLDNDSAARNYLEVFDTDIRYQITDGNTPAPKGHYILEAFNQDRTAASEITGLNIITSGRERPSVVAFFAGRVFYGGVHSNKFGANIYFSQIIENVNQAGRCYQSADPTDEDVPDLLPSDGGVIVIPEAAEVVRLFPKGDSLFVFAVNGIWQITGSEGIGFKANDYSINKVTDTPALTPLSFVSVDGNPVWWNRSGIWTLATANGPGGAAQVQSLTDQTIKAYYEQIPAESKKWAKGAYNHQTKIIQWVYASIAPVNEVNRMKYDRVMNFNILSGAFYIWTTGTPSARFDLVDDAYETVSTIYVRGIVSVEGDSVTEVELPVTVDGDPVTADSNPVTVSKIFRQAQDSTVKLIFDKIDAEDDPDAPEPPAGGGGGGGDPGDDPELTNVYFSSTIISGSGSGVGGAYGGFVPIAYNGGSFDIGSLDSEINNSGATIATSRLGNGPFVDVAKYWLQGDDITADPDLVGGAIYLDGVFGWLLADCTINYDAGYNKIEFNTEDDGAARGFSAIFPNSLTPMVWEIRIV